MTANDGYAEQTRRLLADTQSELKDIEAQINGLEARKATLQSEARAYEMALQGYLKRLGKQESIEPNWAEALRNEHSHKDRLKAIAKQKGGTIKASEVTDILYTNGFIKSKKRSTAYVVVQTYLAEMTKEGQFRKIAPGEYELVGAQQKFT